MKRGIQFSRDAFCSLSILLFTYYFRYLEEPTVIAAFNGKQTGKHVVHIACGSTYSAAITADGELYTWGRGNYGRLGHGKLHLPQSCQTQSHLRLFHLRK